LDGERAEQVAAVRLRRGERVRGGGADSNVEMTWQVFGGEAQELYLALLKERCQGDGLGTSEEVLNRQFRLPFTAASATWQLRTPSSPSPIWCRSSWMIPHRHPAKVEPDETDTRCVRRPLVAPPVPAL
jgi:hypothetical protein